MTCVYVYYPDRAEWEDAELYTAAVDALKRLHDAALYTSSPGHVEVYTRQTSAPAPAPLTHIGSYTMDMPALLDAVNTFASCQESTNAISVVMLKRLFKDAGRMAAYTLYSSNV